MKRKNIIIFSVILMSTIGFNACSDSSNDNTSIVNCSISDVLDDYTEVLSGDLVVKEDDNTVVSLYQDIDNNKRICVESGSAYISR